MSTSCIEPIEVWVIRIAEGRKNMCISMPFEG